MNVFRTVCENCLLLLVFLCYELVNWIHLHGGGGLLFHWLSQIDVFKRSRADIKTFKRDEFEMSLIVDFDI